MRWATTIVLFLIWTPWASDLRAAPAPRAPIVVALFDDLVPAGNRDTAKKSLNKLVELISEQCDYPISLEIIDGGNQADIKDATQKVERGEIHVLVVSGLEYGWWLGLPRDTPEILALCEPGGVVLQFQELVVKKKDGVEFKFPQDLGGARLATYSQVASSYPIFLQQLREAGPEVLAGEPVPVDHSAAAMHAVCEGKADAAIVDVYARLRFARASEKRFAQLSVVKTSPPYPVPVLAGNRALVEQLQPGLWERFRSTLKDINRHPRAQAYLEVWAQQGFKDPPPDYAADARDAAAKYPFDALPVR